MDNEVEESNIEESNGRECGGYGCGEGDSSDGVIGNWGVVWSDVEFQSYDMNEEELLEFWSDEDAREGEERG